MKTSENGVASIKRNEGYRAFPYQDNGKWAWGYGHDQQPGETIPSTVSMAQADYDLRHDLANRFEPPLNRYLAEHGLTLTQNQFDAWIDMAYNDGPADAITMMAHGVDKVPAQLMRWIYEHVDGVPVKVPALEARRKSEVALFVTPDQQAA